MNHKTFITFHQGFELLNFNEAESENFQCLTNIDIIWIDFKNILRIMKGVFIAQFPVASLTAWPIIIFNCSIISDNKRRKQ